MSLFFLQLAIVAVCIGIGGRFGGVGLGAAGGLGVTILVLGFGMKPAAPPINVLLIIIAVIACSSVLQGAGGLDYLVSLAEKALRKKPDAITFLGPLICSVFVMFCGTSYVAFAVYPVIAEVAAEAKIRPERPIAMSVIAGGIAIVGSPMSAATAGMISALAGFDISIASILTITIPAFFIGCFMGCLSVYRRGEELENDPEFQRRVAAGEYQAIHSGTTSGEPLQPSPMARRALLIFALGILAVVVLGSSPSLLPSWTVDGKIQRLSTPHLIQMIMLSAACIMMVACKIPPNKLASGSVFRSGLIGVVGVFGVSWMTGTYFEAYKPFFVALFSGMVGTTPMLFGVILFCFSVVIFSPAATVAALMPLGVALGIPPGFLIALYPACCGDFIVPGAGQIGCVSFDRTGTTKIGRFVVNHSYLLPGFVMVISSVIAGWLIAKLVF